MRSVCPAATSSASCWPASCRRPPVVLVAAQPTRGLDVGAIEYMNDRLRGRPPSGIGVLLISTELEEILDAVATASSCSTAGGSSARCRREDIDLERLGLLMGGDGGVTRRPSRSTERPAAEVAAARRATSAVTIGLYVVSIAVALVAVGAPRLADGRLVVRRCFSALLDGSLRSRRAVGDHAGDGGAAAVRRPRHDRRDARRPRRTSARRARCSSAPRSPRPSPSASTGPVR